MPEPKRIGIHLSTAGGPHTAVQRAVDCGANCFQIFSASPRTWQAAPIQPQHAQAMRLERVKHNIAPLVIHASYLINLCSQTELVRTNSTAAFRAEVERALALGANFLVLHPGSWKGITHAEALAHAAENIARATADLPCADSNLRILIENSAGSEFSMGRSFDQIAELLQRLDRCAPVDCCLDTCHTHVAGYDLVDGYESTVEHIAQTIGLHRIRVWHCNDAKAPMGSRLDRHQHIGEGTLGAAPFRRLLQDTRFAHAAFIAETPVDHPSDILRNVSTLQALAQSEPAKSRPPVRRQPKVRHHTLA